MYDVMPKEGRKVEKEEGGKNPNPVLK